MEMGKKIIVYSKTCRYAFGNNTQDEVDYTYLSDTPQNSSNAINCQPEVPPMFLYSGIPQNRVSQVNILGKKIIASKTCRYAYNNDATKEVDFTYLSDTPQNSLTSALCPAEGLPMFLYAGTPQNRVSQIDMFGKRILSTKTCRYASGNDSMNEVDFTYLFDTPQNILN